VCSYSCYISMLILVYTACEAEYDARSMILALISYSNYKLLWTIVNTAE
jgi:hypothetical protein